MYQEIDKALDSLRLLHYKIWNYTSINKKAKKRNYAKSNTIGNFIYSLKSDCHKYTLNINKEFVGCIEFVLKNDEEQNKILTDYKQQKTENPLKRGYFEYPTLILPLTKNYSSCADFLTHFLVRELGNDKLNTKKYKIISYKIDKFIEEACIKDKNNTKKFRILIKALKEIEIIDKTAPTIEEMEKMKPKEISQITLKIWIVKDVKKLNEIIFKLINKQ